MKNLPNDFYQKIKKLNQEVKQDLRKKGLVVPKKNTDGSITIGKYTIIKNSAGFFSVVDNRKEIIADKINLPQTAALVANNLALGKWLDKKLIEADSNYGYAEFDELAHRKSARRYLKSKNYERAEIMTAKSNMALYKKNYYMRMIKNDFTKLLIVR